MTQTHWTLAQTLQSRGLSPHALAKVSGLSKNTVYDIVNGKSHGITLETVDRLLNGLEQLTGQRMALEAVLDRQEPEDPYLHLFAGAQPFDWEQRRASLPHWTPEEQVANDTFWTEREAQRQARGTRGNPRLDQLAEIFGPADEPTPTRPS